MPFKSKKQMRWMFSNKPDMAKEWASETSSISKLPESKSGFNKLGDYMRQKKKRGMK